MCNRRQSLVRPHREVQCSDCRVPRDVPSDDKDALVGNRRGNQSDIPQTLRIASRSEEPSSREYELQVLSKAQAPLPCDKSRWHCEPPTEFHGTRGTSSRAR